MFLALVFASGLLLPSGANEVRRQIMTVTTGTNATAYVAVTNTTIKGWIDEIKIDQVTAGTTGTVTLVMVPELSTLANVTLVTSTNCNGDLTYRPRVDATDTSGTALTTDPPVRYAACGDTFVFSVTNGSATNISFKAVIKYEADQ